MQAARRPGPAGVSLPWEWSREGERSSSTAFKSVGLRASQVKHHSALPRWRTDLAVGRLPPAGGGRGRRAAQPDAGAAAWVVNRPGQARAAARFRGRSPRGARATGRCWCARVRHAFCSCLQSDTAEGGYFEHCSLCLNKPDSWARSPSSMLGSCSRRRMGDIPASEAGTVAQVWLVGAFQSPDRSHRRVWNLARPVQRHQLWGPEAPFLTGLKLRRRGVGGGCGRVCQRGNRLLPGGREEAKGCISPSH